MLGEVCDHNMFERTEAAAEWPGCQVPFLSIRTRKEPRAWETGAEECPGCTLAQPHLWVLKRMRFVKSWLSTLGHTLSLLVAMPWEAYFQLLLPHAEVHRCLQGGGPVCPEAWVPARPVEGKAAEPGWEGLSNAA